jgi:CheY-like chemotaxis protein
MIRPIAPKHRRDGVRHFARSHLRRPSGRRSFRVQTQAVKRAVGRTAEVQPRVINDGCRPETGQPDRVLSVTGGGSAVAPAQTFRPDLILLDIGLPDIDGYEIARRIRRTGCTARLGAVTG